MICDYIETFFIYFTKRGILGTSTIILSKDIDKYAFMCGSILMKQMLECKWNNPLNIYNKYLFLIIAQ